MTQPADTAAVIVIDLQTGMLDGVAEPPLKGSDALIERGLKVTVVGDAHGTWDWGGETAEEIIDRHNSEFEAAGARVVTTLGLTGA